MSLCIQKECNLEMRTKTDQKSRRECFERKSLRSELNGQWNGCYKCRTEYNQMTVGACVAGGSTDDEPVGIGTSVSFATENPDGTGKPYYIVRGALLCVHVNTNSCL